MSFLFINKTLQVNNLKTWTAMNAKISVFAICVKAIIYSLSYNLQGCTFKLTLGGLKWSKINTKFALVRCCIVILKIFNNVLHSFLVVLELFGVQSFSWNFTWNLFFGVQSFLWNFSIDTKQKVFKYFSLWTDWKQKDKDHFSCNKIVKIFKRKELLFKVRLNDDLVNYFPLMSCYGISTNILHLTFSRAKFWSFCIKC